MLLWLMGCAPSLPEAPERVEELLGYLFAHLGDQQEAELQSGIANLTAKLSTGVLEDDRSAGFAVDSISEDMLEGLELQDLELLNSIVGIGVHYTLPHPPEAIARALFVEDWGEISADTYDSYQRSFSADPSCLIGQSCTWLEYELQTEAEWVGGLMQTKSSMLGQVRWVETSAGWVLLQRFWLAGPVEISPDVGVEFLGQYYVHLSMPNGSGSTRIQAMWLDADYGDLMFDEDWGQNQILEAIQAENQTLSDWLGESQ